MRLGALEAGGTKMVCAIGDETGRIQEQISIPTTTPEETMPKIIAYFRDKDIDALGIAALLYQLLAKNEKKFLISRILVTVSIVAGMMDCFLI